MNKLLTILSLSFSSVLMAQPTFDWAEATGSASSDQGKEIVVDAAGNSYILGDFRNTVDFDPGAGTANLTAFGGIDVFLQKLDSDGNLIWVKQFGGTSTDQGMALSIDGNGNLIISGQFQGTADFDPNAGTATLTAVGSYYDTYIVKLDNNGNLIWVKQLDSSHHCFAVDMGVSSTNDIYLTGRFFGTADFDPGAGTNNVTASGTGWDAYILKLASDGTFTWVKQITCSTDMYNQSLAVDQVGSVIVGGYYYNVIDLDPGPGTVTYNAGSFQEDMFLVKLDVNGNYAWGHNFTSSVTEMAYSIHVDANNDYYIGGWFSATMDFDPGAGSTLISPNGDADGFVLKLNSAGAFQWVNTMGGSFADEVWSVTSDSQGDILVSGTFSDVVDLDPGAGTANFTSAGVKDAFVQKVANTGAHIWTVAYGGTGQDYGTSIASGINGAILIAGNYSLTADFDPGVGTASATSVGAADIFALKLSECVSSALTPDVATLPDLTGECSINAPTAPTASNCTQSFNGVADVTFPITTPGTTVVTWTYNDGGGNTLTQTQNAVIADITAPVPDASPGSGAIDINQDLNTSCMFDFSEVETAQSFQATSSNICGAGIELVASGLGVCDVTIELYDNLPNSGGVMLASGTVSATDGTWADVSWPSVSIVPGTTYYLKFSGSNPSQCVYGHTGDPYTGGMLYSNPGYNPVASFDATFRTYAGCTPALADITAECQVTALTAPTATDNCAGAVTGTHNANLPITSQGTTVVTWTYTDNDGNSSTQTQNVVITDVTAPVPDVATLPDITSDCSVSSLTAPTATDNCSGTVTATHDAVLPITAQGLTVVTWTYDDGNGNFVSQPQNVILNDVTAPVADAASLNDVTAECEVNSLTVPTATDNCAGTINGTHNASLPITSQGTTVVTWTFNDGNGNTSTQSQNIIIGDVTAPVADLANLPDVTGECDATPSAPTANDNCVGALTGTPDVSFPITAQGTTVVTWTYDDGHGNTTTQTQNVILSDVTAPVADVASLSDITSECEVTPTAPTASDNCTGAVTGTADVSFPVTAAGTTVVTWTYDDGNGNTSTQTQNVIITPIDNGVTQVDAATLTADASGYNYQWVDCDNSNAPINGENGQTFVATVAGNYAVEIDNGTCTVVSACTQLTVGIDELFAAFNLSVSPNPTRDIITLQYSEGFSATGELMDAQGRAIKSFELSGTAHALDLETLPEGMYLIVIRFEQQKQVIKVQKL